MAPATDDDAPTATQVTPSKQDKSDTQEAAKDDKQAETSDKPTDDSAVDPTDEGTPDSDAESAANTSKKATSDDDVTEEEDVQPTTKKKASKQKKKAHTATTKKSKKLPTTIAVKTTALHPQDILTIEKNETVGLSQKITGNFGSLLRGILSLATQRKVLNPRWAKACKVTWTNHNNGGSFWCDILLKPFDEFRRHFTAYTLGKLSDDQDLDWFLNRVSELLNAANVDASDNKLKSSVSTRTTVTQSTTPTSASNILALPPTNNNVDERLSKIELLLAQLAQKHVNDNNNSKKKKKKEFRRPPFDSKLPSKPNESRSFEDKQWYHCAICGQWSPTHST